MEDLSIQELHQYHKLIKLGILDPIKCPSDKDHIDMIPNYDFEKDISYFNCLSCNTKLKIGENFKKSVRRQLDIFKNL
jgi:hypothetical protein